MYAAARVLCILASCDRSHGENIPKLARCDLGFPAAREGMELTRGEDRRRLDR